MFIDRPRFNNLSSQAIELPFSTLACARLLERLETSYCTEMIVRKSLVCVCIYRFFVRLFFPKRN